MPRLSIHLRTQPPAEPALDQNQIVQAALTLLDEVGLDGLTMRRLAERLNIKAASLYWHVRDKEELIMLLANEICAAVSAPDPALTWRRQLEVFGHDYRRVLLAHRDAARVLVLSGPPSGPNRLNLVEFWLTALLKAGFTPRDAAFTAFLLNDHVTMFVMEETRDMAQPTVPPAKDVETAGETTAAKDQAAAENWIETLPRDQYPSIVALAPHIANINMDEQFAFGLEILLDGLEKRLAGANHAAERG